MNGKPWTHEEDLVLLDNPNLSPKELQQLIANRTYASINLRRSKFIKEGKLPKLHKTVSKQKFSAKELLDAVRLYRSHDALKRACVGNSALPNPKTVQKEFGSWTEARKLADVYENNSQLVDYYPTVLYLVYFEEGFYKIGITQRDIRTRLHGYPPYIVVDKVTYPDLESAKSTEAEIISNVIIDPSLLKLRGKTECFRSDIEITSLEELL